SAAPKSDEPAASPPHPSAPPTLTQPARGAQVWNIPPPVRSFLGREPELEALRDRLKTWQRVALPPAAALHGMGGVGKTQLARAYAHQHRDDYTLGWWI